jgi:hypothetical protein
MPLKNKDHQATSAINSSRKSRESGVRTSMVPKNKANKPPSVRSSGVLPPTAKSRSLQKAGTDASAKEKKKI